MEKLWFKTAGAAFGLSASLILADATKSNPHYSFWVNPLAFGVYATATIGFIGLICGLLNIRLTRSSFVLGEDALRKVAEIGAMPSYTGAEKHRFLKPYIGMWMQIAGTLIDVGPRVGSSSRVTVQTYLPDFIAFMNFRDKGIVNRYLEMLSSGTQMTVIGKIKRIDTGSISLVRCRIVSASTLGYPAILIDYSPALGLAARDGLHRSSGPTSHTVRFPRSVGSAAPPPVPQGAPG